MSDETMDVSTIEIENLRKENNITSIFDNQERLNKIKILHPEELKDMNINPIEYVLYPCLPSQGIGMIYASAGIGKTLFTLNIAYAIAGGGEFLKYKCPKPRKVLYVDGEMPLNQLHLRMNTIIKNQGKLIDGTNLKLLTPDMNLSFQIPRIDELEDQDLYLKLINSHDCEVVIFDNLSVLSSIDLNKGDEWKIIQNWFLSLRALGKTVIFIHHSGKDKLGYRGTSRMLDVLDVAVSLQPIVSDEIDSTSSSTKFKVVYHKNRCFSGSDSNPFEVIFENDQWIYQSLSVSQIDRVVECLNANMKQVEIAKELLVSQPTVHRLIKKAKLTCKVKDKD